MPELIPNHEIYQILKNMYGKITVSKSIHGVPGVNLYTLQGPEGPRDPGGNFEAIRGVIFLYSYCTFVRGCFARQTR